MDTTIFINHDGKEVLKTPHSALFFLDGMCAIRDDSRKWGFIDKNGEIVVPLKYDDAGSFHDGLAYVKIGYDYGYINKSGEIIIDIKIRWFAPDFTEGLAAISSEGKWGFIDKTGSFVIQQNYKYNIDLYRKFNHAPKSTYVPKFSEGLLPIEINNKFGYINKLGEVAIDPIFDYGKDFSNGLGAVNYSGKWGYITHSGEWHIKPSYNYAANFSEGIAWVSNSISDSKKEQIKSASFIDKEGNIVFDIKSLDTYIENIFEFKENLAAIEVKISNTGTYGFIDKNGKIVIKPEFGCFTFPSFSEGLAAMKKDNKSIFIDKEGKTAIETNAWITVNFSEGLAALCYK